jgi:hypothetical protein
MYRGADDDVREDSKRKRIYRGADDNVREYSEQTASGEEGGGGGRGGWGKEGIARKQPQPYPEGKDCESTAVETTTVARRAAGEGKK